MNKKQVKRAFWLELACVLEVTLLCTFLLIWKTYSPLEPVAETILVIASISDAVAFVLTIRALNKTNIKGAFLTSIKELIARLAGVAMRVYERFGWFRRQNDALGSTTTVSFDYSAFEKRKSKQKPFKPPRWKDMQTARQKLGYLYYSLITKRIKGGAPITAHDTPSELKSRWSNTEAEEKIFDLYIISRYDERAELNEQEISDLKERLK